MVCYKFSVSSFELNYYDLLNHWRANVTRVLTLAKNYFILFYIVVGVYVCIYKCKVIVVFSPKILILVLIWVVICPSLLNTWYWYKSNCLLHYWSFFSTHAILFYYYIFFAFFFYVPRQLLSPCLLLDHFTLFMNLYFVMLGIIYVRFMFWLVNGISTWFRVENYMMLVYLWIKIEYWQSCWNKVILISTGLKSSMYSLRFVIQLFPLESHMKFGLVPLTSSIPVCIKVTVKLC